MKKGKLSQMETANQLKVEKYLVLGESDCEYIITVQEYDDASKDYILHYSNNSEWTDEVKSKEIMRILDNGDEYELPKLPSIMTADALDELHLLLSFIKKYEKHLAPERKIVKMEVFATV